MLINAITRKKCSEIRKQFFLAGKKTIFEFFKKIIFIYYLLCVCVGRHTCYGTYGGQRMTFVNPFSPSTIWVPGIKLSSLSLATFTC